MKYFRYALLLSTAVFHLCAMKWDTHMRPEVICSKEPRYGVPSETHITLYLLANTELNNTMLATATFVAYGGVPQEKTADILKSHLFAHSDFKNLFTTDSNMIIFQSLWVKEEYRFKGLGSHLMSKAFSYLGSNHGNSIVVWKAQPYDQKTLSLEKLCALYIKHGGIILGSGNEGARFYKKV